MTPAPQLAMAREAQAARETATPLGIICGGGRFPLQVAAAVRQSGRPVFLLGIEGNADPAITDYPHGWFRLGQWRRPRELLQAAGCRDICLIGNVTRPRLTSLRFDLETLAMLPRYLQLRRGGDDRLLRGIGGLIEDASGFRIVGVREVAPTVLAPLGPFGKRAPSPADDADIACGLAVLAATGRFDIGQAVVVARGRVVALEAAEGTDAMLQRVAHLRGQGRLDVAAATGVLVKAPKPHQDDRLDLPAIGLETVRQAAAAGLAGIAVAAGVVVVADAAEIAAAADAAKLFVTGVNASGA